jgi:hypothetical protein
MKNGHLEQFLDTGWYTEATLYLDGYVYWCEAQSDINTGLVYFFVDRWAAENEKDTYYHSILESDGTLKWNRIFEVEDKNLDIVKKRFLEAPIFNGKTFWQVEKNIAWLDEGSPIIKTD